MVTADDVDDLIGAVVLDRRNHRIGEVQQVLRGPDGRRPGWIGVRIGMEGVDVLVPLEGAEWDDEALRIAVSRNSTDGAPDIVGGRLSDEAEERLLTHYGIPCVRHPREPIDFAAYGAGISYSVHDGDPDGGGDDPLLEQRQLSEAMAEPGDPRTHSVSGRSSA